MLRHAGGDQRDHLPGQLSFAGPLKEGFAIPPDCQHRSVIATECGTRVIGENQVEMFSFQFVARVLGDVLRFRRIQLAALQRPSPKSRPIIAE